MIKLSPALSLPLSAITQTNAIIGRKGSGKTYLALRLFELFFAEKAQCIAIDPVGLWYGLRIDADGKKPSSIQIPIFGGERADVPLLDGSGKVIAEFLHKTGSSAILDVSGFSKNKRRQFLTDFAETLFQLQKKNREPVHLFFDEAQLFVPQVIGEGEQRMYSAMEDIVRIGRNFGIGSTLISTQPQSINKTVLNLAEPLFVFQLMGAHERKAISDWIKHQGVDANELLDLLPGLKPGDGLFWSPSWMERFEKVRCSKRTTLDTTSTPVLGQTRKVIEVKPADLGNLSEEIKAMVQEAEENNVPALKKQLQELRQVVARKDDLISKQKISIEHYKQLAENPKAAPVDNNLLDELSAVIARHRQKPVVGKPVSFSPSRETVTEMMADIRGGQDLSRGGPVKVVPPTGKLHSPHQKILDSLAWWEASRVPGPYSRLRVAFIAGYSHKGSAFSNPVSNLRTSGLLDYMDGALVLTEAGRRKANEPRSMPTQTQVHDAVMSKLNGPQQKLLAPLLECHPSSYSREQLAIVTGYSAAGSAFTNPISSLRSLGLIDYPTKGTVRAHNDLFIN